MNNKIVISVIGLGYVGLKLAVAFGKNSTVIGYDINPSRIHSLVNHIHVSQEVSELEMQQSKVQFTCNPLDLQNSNIYIIAVPTPLTKQNKPDFSIILSTTELIANNLKPGNIIIYESTFYPGFTEEICIPILEKISQMRCGIDFNVAYSPERVNPGDKNHTLENIAKIVAATNAETLDRVTELYSTIIENIYPVATIRVAEATKIIENVQRDINIAFINEATYILHSFGMEITEVLAAMKTKWNALSFRPGMVGGHCLHSNSYYLLHKAESLGFDSKLIAEGRKSNEYMPKFIVDELCKQYDKSNTKIINSRIGILGITFKENCSDLHDTRVIEIINQLIAKQATIYVHDPIADPALAKETYEIDLLSLKEFYSLDAVILLVAHDQFLGIENILIKITKPNGIIMDAKGVLNPIPFKTNNKYFWRI